MSAAHVPLQMRPPWMMRLMQKLGAYDAAAVLVQLRMQPLMHQLVQALTQQLLVQPLMQ